MKDRLSGATGEIWLDYAGFGWIELGEGWLALAHLESTLAGGSGPPSPGLPPSMPRLRRTGRRTRPTAAVWGELAAGADQAFGPEPLAGHFRHGLIWFDSPLGTEVRDQRSDVSRSRISVVGFMGWKISSYTYSPKSAFTGEKSHFLDFSPGKRVLGAACAGGAIDLAGAVGSTEKLGRESSWRWSKQSPSSHGVQVGNAAADAIKCSSCQRCAGAGRPLGMRIGEWAENSGWEKRSQENEMGKMVPSRRSF
jgi:hypothetical protein